MKHLKVYSLIVVLLITYRGVVAQLTKIKGQVFDKTSKLPNSLSALILKETNDIYGQF